MNITILLICTKTKVVSSLKYTLSKYDYGVAIESNIDHAVYKINVENYLAVIIEADTSILYNIAKIRDVSEVPVYVLFDNHCQDTIYDCFDTGMDDYFINPFPYTEISYKIRRTLRRNSTEVKKRAVKFKKLIIDYDTKVVKIGAKRLVLTRVEFEILYFLLINQNAIVSRKRIYQTVWKRPFYEGDRCVDTHVCLLRKKLEEYGIHLVSKRNYGYSFDTEVTK